MREDDSRRTLRSGDASSTTSLSFAAPRPTWPHCLRLLTGRTADSFDLEARYVLDDVEMRVRISRTRAFGTSSWGCVEHRRSGDWERVLWVDVADLAISRCCFEDPPEDWRALIGDDSHELARQAALALDQPQSATA